MSDQDITPNSQPTAKVTQTPGRCFTGASLAGLMAFGAYNMMMAIAGSFASKPIHSDNQIVVKISSAVRTLVVGISALGMSVFGIVAIGLFVLGIQMTFQQLTAKDNKGM
jgi:fucose permease